jgi:hypothetical protein
MVEITAAAVRLYARALEIEQDVEDEIEDALTYEELLAGCDRLVSDAEIDEDDDRRAVKAILAQHREYQYVKSELGKQLRLEPTDINPLDMGCNRSWATDDDPGIAIWKRAYDVYRRLSDAYMDSLCWWRPKASAGKDVIRLGPGAGPQR